METRRTTRFKIDTKISCIVDEEVLRKFRLICGGSFVADAFDISESGIGLLSKYLLPETLILRLKMDGALFGLKETIEIKGEVRYCKYIKDLGYKCGVRFLNIPDTYREAIVHFISRKDKSLL